MMHTASFMALAALIASSNALSIPTAPKVARADLVAAYGQCGGINHTGATECVSGSSCVNWNPYYYQCVPGAVASSSAPGCAAPSAESTSSSAVVATTEAAVSTTKAAAGTPTSSQAAATTSAKVSTSTKAVELSTSAEPTSTEPVSTSVAPVIKPTSVEVSSTAVASTSTEIVASTSKAAVTTPSEVASAASSKAAVPTTSNAPATTSQAAFTTSSATTSSAAPAQTLVSSSSFLAGVNLAGFDFSVSTDGSFSGDGQDPPTSQITHFASQGVNLFRVPFAWQLATPTLGGTVDSSFLTRYDTVVKAALASASDAHVILDLHNYARWNGAIIGQGGPTNDQFANLWSQLAAHYKDESRVIFGVMNEPHDIPNLTTWAASVQAAVDAIRKAGATTQTIIIPGSTWAHASALPTEAGPALLTVTDPAGGVNKLLFDVHQYLDSDGSGTNSECTTDNTDVLNTLISWLKTNGRQAMLTETGGGNTSSCQTKLNTQLALVKANSQYITGYTVWAAGSFDTSYVLSVTPDGSSDNALWTSAVKPNLA